MTRSPEPPAVEPLDIDLEALEKDLNELRDRLRAESGDADVAHLKKMIRWGRASTFVGWATSWIMPNPVSAYLISQGTFARWAMVAHHVLHRGYDKVEGAPERYTSKKFAKGWRRVIDWLDWIEPDAWIHEHNFQHHYKLGESHDPDQPELNLEFLRDMNIPTFAKKAIVGFFMFTWKYLYYAPNTTGELHFHQEGHKKAPGERLELFDVKLWLPFTSPGYKLWGRSWVPYFLVRFVLMPAPFALLGPWAWGSAVINMALAEAMTNLHAFIIIVPNHAGEDIYRFDEPIKNRAEFYLHQIVGTANYRTGGNVNDFLHGFLNYQIEHHLWPDLTMLAYQKAQPEVQKICEKHNVPYVQEGVFTRVRKLVDVMVGKATMKVWPGLLSDRHDSVPAAAE